MATPLIQNRSIIDLKPDARNARVHKPRQIALLAKSIKAFGFNVPILIDSEGNVLAGHCRLLACEKLGMTEVPTIELSHLSADQAKAFMIADNRLTEIAIWNDELLGEQLKALSSVELDFDIEATGFTVGEIDLRIETLDVESDPADDPVISSGPAVTQERDIWELGKHRLHCGSALDEDAYVPANARTAGLGCFQ